MFSVLPGPCKGNVRESNSEASSCRSKTEYDNENRRSTTEFPVRNCHGNLVVEVVVTVNYTKYVGSRNIKYCTR
jgi:hypothetical protein